MAVAERLEPRLGELLLQRGAVERDALVEVLGHQKKEGIPLGQALIAHGAATEADVWDALAMLWGVGVRDLEHHWIDPALANELEATAAIGHRVLPIRSAGEGQIGRAHV